MTHPSDPLQPIVGQFRQDWQPPVPSDAPPSPRIEDVLEMHRALWDGQSGVRQELLRRLLTVELEKLSEYDVTFVPDDYRKRFPHDLDLMDELGIAGQPPPPARPQPGSVCGEYELLKVLGEGGMGIVWKARHRTSGREVALKLPNSKQFGTRDLEFFLRETQHQNNLRHGHILPLLEVGPPSLDRSLPLDEMLARLGGQMPYAVYELVDGGWTLQRVLDAGNVTNLPRLLQRLTEVCSALGYMHSRHEPVYHLDLKPENILVRDSGRRHTETALLADFGLSTRGTPDHAGGTQLYMSPERLKAQRGMFHDGDLSHPGAADVWAIGVMLYEGLTGQKPFASPSLILRDDFTPRPIREGSDNPPAALIDLADECLSREPSARPSAGQVKERLQQCHDSLPPMPDWSRTDVPTAVPGADSTRPQTEPAANDADPQSDQAAADSAGSHAAARASRASELFVGRDDELAQIERRLLSGNGGVASEAAGHGQGGRSVAIVAVQGLPGIGKTYLADRFLHLYGDRFGGEPVRLVLPRGEDRSLDQMRDELLDRLDVPATGDVWTGLRTGLSDRLLLVENVDTGPLAAAVTGLARQLTGCSLLVTGRSAQLGEEAGWTPVRVSVLSPEESAEQLREELGPQRFERLTDSEQAALIERLAGLPLALHLAAGYLRSAYPVERFLERLTHARLKLPERDIADPEYGRAVLHAAFETSLDTLRSALANLGSSADDVDGLVHGFRRLGHGPLSGIGRSLAGAVSGLEPGALADVLLEASALSLLDRDGDWDGDDTDRFRLHPLLSEWLAEVADGDNAAARMTDWFVPRLRAADPTRRTAPGEELDDSAEEHRAALRAELHAEYATLPHWLPRVPPARRREVERAGSLFAIALGPFLAWRRFCERGLDATDDPAEQSDFLWTLGQVCLLGGDADTALDAARRKQTVDTKRDAPRDAALAAGLIADVLMARGELDEALRIRREEQLPVYERLGDVRSLAVAQGKIADVLMARGELDEALRIRREEQLPVYERLGDVRSLAVTQGKIADVLMARGELDEALRIRREEELPVCERLGDVRSLAVAQGKIADVLMDRGELDEALRIRREEQLPVYERLGDVRSLAVGQANSALNLLARNATGDRDEAAELLRQAHAAAERMGIPEAGQIRRIQESEGLEF